MFKLFKVFKWQNEDTEPSSSSSSSSPSSSSSSSSASTMEFFSPATPPPTAGFLEKTEFLDCQDSLVIPDYEPSVLEFEEDGYEDCLCSIAPEDKISGVSEFSDDDVDGESERSFVSVDAPPERDLDMESGDIVFTWGQMRYVLPGRIAGLLYLHQKSGLEWLWSIHTKGEGGVLGDDMGLGKTMQICSFLAGLFHSQLDKRVLVVAPKTIIAHWIKELTAVGLLEKTRN